MMDWILQNPAITSIIVGLLIFGLLFVVGYLLVARGVKSKVVKQPHDSDDNN